MEIVKRGTTPGERKCFGKCGQCRTEIIFACREGTYNSDQREGEWWSYKCPVCHGYISGTIKAYANYVNNKNVDPY